MTARQALTDYASRLKTKLLTECIEVLKSAPRLSPSEYPSNAWEDFKEGASSYGETCADLFQEHIGDDLRARIHALSESELLILWNECVDEDDIDANQQISDLDLVTPVYECLLEDLKHAAFIEGPFDWDDEPCDTRPKLPADLAEVGDVDELLYKHFDSATGWLLGRLSDETLRNVLNDLYDEYLDNSDSEDPTILSKEQFDQYFPVLKQYILDWRANFRARMEHLGLRSRS